MPSRGGCEWGFGEGLVEGGSCIEGGVRWRLVGKRVWGPRLSRVLVLICFFLHYFILNSVIVFTVLYFIDILSKARVPSLYLDEYMFVLLLICLYNSSDSSAFRTSGPFRQRFRRTLQPLRPSVYIQCHQPCLVSSISIRCLFVIDCLLLMTLP